ncbi:hypothetical protein [Paenibacillus xanthanilyticus]|uniref:DUF4352 domain-containing protein n=1 Tax=Paenibacillus xanthanilyticus TaxID=1783531 RepID=A0ABV8K9N5_9BACL
MNKKSIIPILIIILVFLVDYVGSGLISNKILPPKVTVIAMDVSSAAADGSTTFSAIKESKEDVVYLQKTDQLGNANQYAFVTLTVDIKNSNYLRLKNVNMALLPKSSENKDAILYLRDVQYVEVSPLSSGKSSISILLNGSDLDKVEAKSLLQNYSLEITWNNNERVYGLQDLTYES